MFSFNRSDLKNHFNTENRFSWQRNTAYSNKAHCFLHPTLTCSIPGRTLTRFGADYRRTKSHHRYAQTWRLSPPRCQVPKPLLVDEARPPKGAAGVLPTHPLHRARAPPTETCSSVGHASRYIRPRLCCRKQNAGWGWRSVRRRLVGRRGFGDRRLGRRSIWRSFGGAGRDEETAYMRAAWAKRRTGT